MGSTFSFTFSLEEKREEEEKGEMYIDDHEQESHTEISLHFDDHPLLGVGSTRMTFTGF